MHTVMQQEQAATAAVQMSGTVLLNELRGHRQIYDAIKGMLGGKECAVGIVHNVFWLEPKGDGLAYSHVKCAAPPSKPPPPPSASRQLLLAALCGFRFVHPPSPFAVVRGPRQLQGLHTKAIRDFYDS